MAECHFIVETPPCLTVSISIVAAAVVAGITPSLHPSPTFSVCSDDLWTCELDQLLSYDKESFPAAERILFPMRPPSTLLEGQSRSDQRVSPGPNDS